MIVAQPKVAQLGNGCTR